MALALLSEGYSKPEGRLSTCYAPVRRCTQDRSPFLARLACVKHAASVRSEPGSNSPIELVELGERDRLRVGTRLYHCFELLLLHSKNCDCSAIRHIAGLLFSFQRPTTTLLARRPAAPSVEVGAAFTAAHRLVSRGFFLPLAHLPELQGRRSHSARRRCAAYPAREQDRAS